MAGAQPGQRTAFGDDLAPFARLIVEGTELQVDVTQHVQSIEFESSLEMADMLKIVVNNPGLLDPELAPEWSAYKGFAHGNEAHLYLGYGGASQPENFVGAAVWAKHLPIFPRDGVPQLEIKGYDRAHQMMDLSGRITSSEGRGIRLEQARPTDDADDQGQVFENVLHSEVVEFIADMYGLQKDIDPTEVHDNVVLRKGMKHYEIVRGLANLNNRDFWIDYTLSRRAWTLHWKDVAQRGANEASQQYIFRYGSGDATTLMEFEPEYGLREQINEATILIFDQANARWVSAIEIADFEGPDPIFRPGGGLEARAQSRAQNPRSRRARGRALRESRGNSQIIDEALENAEAFRIAAGGYSIDVLPPGQRFRNAEEAAQFLRRWFLARRDNFITGRGSVLGVETLRARQTHRLEGLGARLSGEYFFTNVRHSFGADGYYCEFDAHKVMQD